MVLLLVLRKVFSLMVLERSRTRTQKFLSKIPQFGFRCGRSTSEITWSQFFLVARADHHKKVLRTLGSDLSRAFGIMGRAKLLKVLKRIPGGGEFRAACVLLKDSTARVKVDGAYPGPFDLNTGSPQGDGLGPILFIVFVEARLKEVRAKLRSRPDSNKNMAHESQYAEDRDRHSTSKNGWKIRSMAHQRFLKNMDPQSTGQNRVGFSNQSWFMGGVKQIGVVAKLH